MSIAHISTQLLTFFFFLFFSLSSSFKVCVCVCVCVFLCFCEYFIFIIYTKLGANMAANNAAVGAGAGAGAGVGVGVGVGNDSRGRAGTLAREEALVTISPPIQRTVALRYISVEEYIKYNVDSKATCYLKEWTDTMQKIKKEMFPLVVCIMLCIYVSLCLSLSVCLSLSLSVPIFFLVSHAFR
jgi:Ca2+/Na+ antiporter